MLERGGLGCKTVFVCALREARIICMVCFKLSRAAVACQNSSTCVCVSDCSSAGGDLPGPPTSTHSHGSSLKYKKKKKANYRDINIYINIYIQN